MASLLLQGSDQGLEVTLLWPCLCVEWELLSLFLDLRRAEHDRCQAPAINSGLKKLEKIPLTKFCPSPWELLQARAGDWDLSLSLLFLS